MVRGAVLQESLVPGEAAHRAWRRRVADAPPLGRACHLPGERSQVTSAAAAIALGDRR